MYVVPPLIDIKIRLDEPTFPALVGEICKDEEVVYVVENVIKRYLCEVVGAWYVGTK